MNSITIEGSFSSSHALGHADQVCGPHPHGHDFVVRATFSGIVEPTTGYVRGMEDTFADDFAELLDELDGRRLELMLPASNSTFMSTATAILERLAQKHPAVSSVSVEAAKMRATARRTVR